MKFVTRKISEWIFHAKQTTNKLIVFIKFWISNITKNKRLTCFTVCLVATAYSSYLGIKLSSSLPHDGDVNTDDNQKLLSVETKYSVNQAPHQLYSKLSDVKTHRYFSFCWWFFQLWNHVNVHVNMHVNKARSYFIETPKSRDFELLKMSLIDEN